MNLITHKHGKPYVRLTFLPAGATRRRTVWAVKLSENQYRVVDNSGHGVRDGAVIDGVQSNLTEIILVEPGGPFETVPAGLNRLYAKLEVIKTITITEREYTVGDAIFVMWTKDCTSEEEGAYILDTIEDDGTLVLADRGGNTVWWSYDEDKNVWREMAEGKTAYDVYVG